MRVIPNGIEDPYQDDIRAPAQTSTSGNPPLGILYVGILRESKGVETLHEACGQLLDRGIRFQLNLVGNWESDDFERWARERVEQLRLRERVNFLGVLVGRPKFVVLRRADVLCHPTNFDTFPTVLLEAMAAGIPIVATNLSGIPSMVDDGRTGFLVAPGDPTAVADRLVCLANDVELRTRMGAAGRRRFEREFTLSRHIERMRTVFLDAASAELPKTQPVQNTAAAS